ncbi:MAG: polysaccharide biosynthesis tyrosine autokinase [Synechococcales bacterium]|nr:polysaccharide biosynthesis tyrosine autokinase [Synechococcales bacterium]
MENVPSASSLRTRDSALRLITSGTSSDDSADTPRRGLNFRPFFRTLQRRAFIALGISAAIIGVSLYKNATSEPMYRSSFRLLVEPATSAARIADPSTLTRGDGELPGTRSQVDYPTQIEILKSRAILSEIAERVEASYPGYNYGNLNAGLSVSRVSIATGRGFETGILEVSYTDRDSKIVEIVLQETAQKYLQYSLEDRKNRFSEGVRFIEEQLPDLRQRVNVLQAQLQRLQEEYLLISPETEGQNLSTQVQLAETQQLETQRQLQELKALYGSLQAQLNLSPPEALAAAALSENPQYQTILNQLNDIDSQIAVESVRFSETSPVIRSLQQRRQNLSELLSQEVQQTVGFQVSDSSDNSRLLSYQDSTRLSLIQQMIDTANQIQVLEIRNQEISESKGNLDRRAQQFPAVSRRYSELNRQLEIAARTLDQLLIQRENLRVEAAQDQVPWELINEPARPRLVESSGADLIVAIAVALLAGAGAAVLWERYQDIFYSTEDVQDAIQLPVLGVIPYQEQADQPFNVLSLSRFGEVREDDPTETLFLEAFNSLYASLRFMTSDTSRLRSLVVYSAGPGDGKTTITTYLAHAVAEMGQRVLVVDANLRSPDLHQILKLPNTKGLADVLAGDLDINEAISQVSLSENLFVMTAGQPRIDSTRMLASKHMQLLMERLKERFDLVLYDTPHLIGLTDASFLAANADGIFMTIGVGKTKRSVVMQVLNELEAYRMPSLGVVVNYVKKSSNTTYGYYHSTYKQQQLGRQMFGQQPDSNQGTLAP